MTAEAKARDRKLDNLTAMHVFEAIEFAPNAFEVPATLDAVWPDFNDTGEVSDVAEISHMAVAQMRARKQSMVQSDTPRPEQYLRRKQLADALTAMGYPVTAATLNTKAVRGGGPPYQLFGRFPIYQWGDALAWAQSRCKQPQKRKKQKQPVAAAASPAGPQAA